MSRSVPSPEDLLVHDRFLRQLARSVLFDDHTVDDVVQETWLAALRGGPDDVRSLRGWLAAVTRKLSLKARRADVRRERRHQRAARAEAVPSPAEIAEREATRRALLDALLELEEPAYSTMILRYFEGLPPREIAHRLGVPVETVRSRIKRALERLRTRLDADHGGDRSAWCLALVPLAAAPTRAPGGVSKRGRVFGTNPAVIRAIVAVAVAIVAIVGWRLIANAPPPGETTAVARSAAAPRETSTTVATPAPPRSAANATDPVPARPGSPARDVRGSFAVRVAWESTHEAADGVTAYAEPRDLADPLLRRVWATAGSDGVLRFDDLASGEWEVVCDRGRRVAAHVEAGVSFESALDVAPGIAVEGMVVDRDGSAVAGAAVFLFPHLVESWWAIHATHSGADGSFRLRDVPKAAFVRANAAGFASTPATPLGAVEGATARVRLVLPGPGGAVSGSVIDPDGRGVSHAIVVAGTENPRGIGTTNGQRRGSDPNVFDEPMLFPVVALANERGEFRIDGIAPGATRVAARAPGLAEWSGYFDVPERGAAQVAITLDRGFALLGTVTNAQGHPLGGAAVEIAKDGCLASSRQRTAADGSYRLDGIAAGNVLASAVDEAGNRETRAMCGVPGDEVRWDVQLQPKAAEPPATAEPAVASDAPSAFVEGLVVGADGTPRSDAKVVVRDTATMKDNPHAIDFDGRFRVGPLRPGRYEVSVTTGDGYAQRCGTRAVEPAETWSLGTIRLEAVGHVVAALHGDGADAVDALYFIGTGADGMAEIAFTVANGVARSSAMKPGRYRAVIYGRGTSSDEADVEVRADEDTRVDVDLRPGAAIIVRLTESGEQTSNDAHLVVTDAAGRIVCDVHAGRVGKNGLTAVLGLPRGVYTVDVTTDSGARAHSKIESTDTRVGWDWVEIPLR